MRQQLRQQQSLKWLRSCAKSNRPPPRVLWYYIHSVGCQYCRTACTACKIVCGTRTPIGFTTGRVVTVFKGGYATGVTKYRPITVLNTDYRILARVLTACFNAVMSTSIHAAQTAYLAGRSIGTNIHVPQLLPQALYVHCKSGAMLFLDISKAYETIDRQSLYRCSSMARPMECSYGRASCSAARQL